MSGPRPWQAEQLVSAETAAALVGQWFPQLAPVRATELGAGWDNTADGACVFRFLRRASAAVLLR